jgi:hypothetical protein
VPPFFFALDMATDQELQDAASDALLNALNSPLREQSGTRVIEERSVDDILKARTASASGAAELPGFGMRFTRLISPGGWNSHRC